MGFTIITTKSQPKQLVTIINETVQLTVTNSDWTVTTKSQLFEVTNYLEENDIDYTETHRLIFVKND